MINHPTRSRPFATSSVIAALAIGIALAAAPSAARAETGNQIIMSDGNVSCPPCGFLKLQDQDGLSFRDVAVDVQDGNRIVITAAVDVPGPAGKPRTGSVVFSAFMDYGDDGKFMDYTDDACAASLMSRQAGTQTCDTLVRAFRDAADAAAMTPSNTIVAPSTSEAGIIMRDGGICDPIRHIGC